MCDAGNLTHGANMKVDREIMALMRATKKAAIPPARSIERFRKRRSRTAGESEKPLVEAGSTQSTESLMS